MGFKSRKKAKLSINECRQCDLQGLCATTVNDVSYPGYCDGGFSNVGTHNNLSSALVVRNEERIDREGESAPIQTLQKNRKRQKGLYLVHKTRLVKL